MNGNSRTIALVTILGSGIVAALVGAVAARYVLPAKPNVVVYSGPVEHVFIPISADGQCKLLQDPIAELYAGAGDLIVWTVAGNCTGHFVHVEGFTKGEGPGPDDPFEANFGSRTVPATDGQNIWLKLKPTPGLSTKSKYKYKIKIDDKTADDSDMDVCPSWPC